VWGGWLAEAAYVLYQALDLPFGQSRVQEGVRIFFVLRAVKDGIAEVRITHQIGDSKDIADALVFRRQMHWEFVCRRSNSTRLVTR
jgi:hypothetical protein